MYYQITFYCYEIRVLYCNKYCGEDLRYVPDFLELKHMGLISREGRTFCEELRRPMVSEPLVLVKTYGKRGLDEDLR